MEKPVRVVVSTIPLFAHGCATKFSAPDHQCFFQKSATFEILNESHNRFIDRGTQLGVLFFDVIVAIPLTTRSMIELYKTHSTFYQATGQQALTTEHFGVFFIHTVELFGLSSLAFQIEPPLVLPPACDKPSRNFECELPDLYLIRVPLNDFDSIGSENRPWHFDAGH